MIQTGLCLVIYIKLTKYVLQTQNERDRDEGQLNKRGHPKPSTGITVAHTNKMLTKTYCCAILQGVTKALCD